MFFNNRWWNREDVSAKERLCNQGIELLAVSFCACCLNSPVLPANVSRDTISSVVARLQTQHPYAFMVSIDINHTSHSAALATLHFSCILKQHLFLEIIATYFFKLNILFYFCLLELQSWRQLQILDYIAKKRVYHPFVSLSEKMTTHLIPSPSVTCQPPHALSHWQLTACEAMDHGCSVRRSGEVGGRQSLMHNVCLRAPNCACVWYVFSWRKLYLNVCHAEGMDGCQRRE